MISVSPFKQSKNSVTATMQWVILACIPGVFVLFYLFGWGIIFNLILACSTALICESVVLHLRARPIKSTLNDYSALVTGVLLAISLPPLAPWWLVVLGTFFAIIFAKHLYGGMGYNPFNPAMVGYVVLLISFPLSMTRWIPPESIATHVPSFYDSLSLVLFSVDSQNQPLEFYRLNVDGFTMATPLDTLKTGFNSGFLESEILSSPVFQGWVNNGWQWVNLAFLMGGVLLLTQKVIRWAIPLSLIISVALLSFVMHSLSPDNFSSTPIHLLSGATMFGAFFIATDPVSASTTKRGRLIYGAGIGCLTVIIRNVGGYPDAIAFAVLIMNMAVPFIDHFTQPKVYGSQSIQDSE